MDKKQLRNTLMLMACAFIWGTAFVAQSVGSGYMGPSTVSRAPVLPGARTRFWPAAAGWPVRFCWA